MDSKKNRQHAAIVDLVGQVNEKPQAGRLTSCWRRSPEIDGSLDLSAEALELISTTISTQIVARVNGDGNQGITGSHNHKKRAREMLEEHLNDHCQ